MAHLKRIIRSVFTYNGIIYEDVGIEEPQGIVFSTPRLSDKKRIKQSLHFIRSRHLQARDTAT